jgi:hypothetical protein
VAGAVPVARLVGGWPLAAAPLPVTMSPVTVSVALPLAVAPPAAPVPVARLGLRVLAPVRLTGRGLSLSDRRSGGRIVVRRLRAVPRALSVRLSGLAVPVRSDPAVTVLMSVRQGLGRSQWRGRSDPGGVTT